MLRIPYNARPRKMGKVEGRGKGQEGRIGGLQKLVTALFRYERIEAVYQHCDETRGYAERLILLAMRNGNKDKKTMETADYWLLEKDLIPKLFDVLVPRYVNYTGAFTQIYRLPTVYPGNGKEMGIIELKGNPWPPVIHKKRNKKYLLTNILLQEVHKDYQDGNLKLQVPGSRLVDRVQDLGVKTATDFTVNKSNEKSSDIVSENINFSNQENQSSQDLPSNSEVK